MYSHRELIIYQVLLSLRARFSDIKSLLDSVGANSNDISAIARDDERFNSLKNMYYSGVYK